MSACVVSLALVAALTAGCAASAGHPIAVTGTVDDTVLTVATSLVLWPVAHTGWLYPLVAGVCGAWFIVEAAMLLRRARAGADDTSAKPMRLFHWSNTYLALVFFAAAMDPVLFRR